MAFTIKVNRTSHSVDVDGDTEQRSRWDPADGPSHLYGQLSC